MDNYTNFARSTVATAPSPATSGTTLVVAAGDGGRFPAVPFNATVWPVNTVPLPTTAEIVRVTARTSDTLTITRAQENTVARTILVGDHIAATITKGLLDQLRFPVFNVQFYGALGNNTHDDTAAFVAAIAAVSAAGGGIVWVPPGQYRLTATVVLPSYVALVGAGPDATQLDGSDISPAGPILEVDIGAGRFAIQALSLVGGQDGLYFAGDNADFALRDLGINTLTGDAIRSDAIERFTVEDLRVESVGGYGWRAGLTDNSDGRMVRFTLVNPVFNNVGLDGIRLVTDGTLQTGNGGVIIDPVFILVGHHGLYGEYINGLVIVGGNAENCSVTTNNTYDALHFHGNCININVVGGQYSYSSLSANGNRYGVYAVGNRIILNGVQANGKTTGFYTQYDVTLDSCEGTVTTMDFVSDWQILQNIRGIGAIPSGNAKTNYPSIPGKDLCQALIDSSANGTGTYGNWEVRRFDASRNRLLSVNGTNGGLVVHQAPTSTADLQEWQYTNGTVVGRVTWDGQGRFASLGVANSAAATTPGSVVKKLEVFDAAGASLGFIAVYDAIT